MLFWLQAPSLMPETSTRRFIILFCCPLLQLVAVSSLTNFSYFLICQSWPDPDSQGLFYGSCRQCSVSSCCISRQKCENEVTPPPPATLAYMILVLPCVDRFDRRANPKHMDWVDMDWVDMDWVDMDWVDMDWVDMDWVDMDWVDTFLLSNGRTPLDMVRERLEATPTLPHGESEDRRLTTKLYHLLTIPQPS